MKKFKSLITEFSQEPGVVDYLGGSFIGEHLVRIGIEDVEFLSEKRLDSGEFLGKEVTIIIGDSESEVPKRELPVIPKYVADWWERDDDSVTLSGGLQVRKKHKFGLISNFHDKGLGDYLSRVEDWLDENDSAFLDLVNGKPYEVEEEQKYYVLLGNQLHDDNWTYALTNLGSIEFFEKDVLPEWDRTKLTEQEIKNYDERFWAFAKPVEEDNDD